MLLYADIDECAENTDGCSQHCTNSIGSYVCSCHPGYRLDADRHTCNGKYICYYISRFLTVHIASDINECAEGIDACAQNCHNNIGSYTCSCNTGYRLASDGFACDGKNFKVVNFILDLGRLILFLSLWFISVCMYSCYESYLLFSDIDECAEGSDQCNQNCHNNVGSYTCSCNTGYRLNPNGRLCDGKRLCC